MNRSSTKIKTFDLNRINEEFAVNVAKTHEPIVLSGEQFWADQREYKRISDGEVYIITDNSSAGSGYWPDYVNSMDAVLPYLCKYDWDMTCEHDDIEYPFKVTINSWITSRGEASTVPVAACIALLANIPK